MRNELRKHIKSGHFQHPLLEKLNRMAAKLAGFNFFVVYPKSEGWGQAFPAERPDIPGFCRQIQETDDGARNCRMCHILMAVTACSKGLTEQRCHAGASILVAPASRGNEENLAVIGTCTFVRSGGAEAWKEVRKRGEELGIDLKKLRKAYNDLPELSLDELELARMIMAAAADAVREIKARYFIEEELRSMRGDHRNKADIETAVELELKEPTLIRHESESGRAGEKKTAPALIRIVSELVVRRPNMPFSVAAIAAAARITPNHFSTLFHQHMGQSFTEFLAEKRMKAAKELLRDLTLNVQEVARKVGYNDPGYFTRCFKQKTGMSPRQWRNAGFPQ